MSKLDLPENEILHIVCTKGQRVIIKEITFGEWKQIKNNPRKGWRYSAYQVGFHSIKATE